MMIVGDRVQTLTGAYRRSSLASLHSGSIEFERLKAYCQLYTVYHYHKITAACLRKL